MTKQTAHPFEQRPHKTLLMMVWPVLLSLAAEPLTGLADTAFVARLHSDALSALGVGTMLLSLFFYAFNFLGIGSQTQIAQAFGADNKGVVKVISTTALMLAVACGILIILIGFPFAKTMVILMGAKETVLEQSIVYFRIRLLAAPAILIATASFGIFRGLQDMRTPSFIALSINFINIIFDPLLIFGMGPIPPYGLAGAAFATFVSQWVGAIICLIIIFKRLGKPQHFSRSHLLGFFVVGRDLFIRTIMLSFFLVLSTRSATYISADAGAAHQSIRQFWIFTAFVLDAFAISGQSLTGFFLGADKKEVALRVAKFVCAWSFGFSFILAGVMISGYSFFAGLLVPPTAWLIFKIPWFISALSQPMNALAFATDGVHWGTGDFKFLRNSVSSATIIGTAALMLLPYFNQNTLTNIWIVLLIWISIRALLGVLRIWPGGKNTPLSVS